MGRATGQRKEYDDIFSRLDTIHERVGRTDTQTDERTDRQTDTGRQQTALTPSVAR